MEARQQQRQQWLTEQLGDNYQCALLSGDASFRQYFRLTSEQGSKILVDAPPDKINMQNFATMAQLLAQAGLQVPVIQQADWQAGFFVLTDFGDALLSTHLTQQNAQQYYQQAIDDLLSIQKIKTTAVQNLPVYDENFMWMEVNLFQEWLINKHLNMKLSQQEKHFFTQACQFIIENAQQQPKTLVHRDYHSRNLMLLNNGQLGHIDFQDAVYGPYSYDLVSLLRDVYQAWPESLEQKLLHYYHEKIKHQLKLSIEFEQLQQDFDCTGLQRHIKIAGIFCRLNYRDGKNNYMADIPNTLQYIIKVGRKYSETQQFAIWLADNILGKRI